MEDLGGMLIPVHALLVPVFTAFAGLKVINYPRLMAALVIATIPVLLVYG